MSLARSGLRCGLVKFAIAFTIRIPRSDGWKLISQLRQTLGSIAARILAILGVHLKEFPMKILLLKSLLAVFCVSLVVATAYAEVRNTFLSSKGKVLIILSSQAQLGNSQIKTGVWLPDATHPYFGLLSAGYEVEFASPLGGAVPIEA